MRSLLSKLLVAHLLVLAIAFGLLAFLLHQVLYPYYVEKIMGQQLLSRGSALAEKLSPLLEKKDQTALNQRLEVAKASLGAEICLVDLTRKVIAHATPEGAAQWSDQTPIVSCCPDFSFEGPNVAAREAGLTACGRDILVAKVPVFAPAQGDRPPMSDSQSPAELPDSSAASYRPAALLLIRAPLSEIQAAAGRLAQLILLCGLVGAALALAAALIIADRISVPLRRMRRMAASMAGGDFASRLEIKSRDEVGQLANSFNTMAEKLRQSLSSLQDESAKLRAVLGSMAEGVVAINAEERILLVNPQTFGVLNLPQQELVGRPLAEAGLPAELAKALRLCLAEHRMISKEISTTAPWQWEGKEDSREPGVAALHVVPMHLGGEEWGAVAVILDVSEAHRLEGMRRRFFSDISHELRTPLTNITGYASALEDGTAADEAARAGALSIILKESERLKRFIEDLLDLSRLESGQPDLQKEWCEIEPIASASAQSLEAFARQARVRVHLDLPRDLPLVFADPDRLSQVLVNLVSNAISFNRPGGEVIVSALAAASEVMVEVKDTGIGISPGELPYVWERFHRGAKRPEEISAGADRPENLHHGTGLGLAIVRSIVQAHGGRVWAESAPGEGSTFGFSLPTE